VLTSALLLFAEALSASDSNFASQGVLDHPKMDRIYSTVYTREPVHVSSSHAWAPMHCHFPSSYPRRINAMLWPKLPTPLLHSAEYQRLLICLHSSKAPRWWTADPASQSSLLDRHSRYSTGRRGINLHSHWPYTFRGDDDLIVIMGSNCAIVTTRSSGSIISPIFNP
jgi:hypothetical protein